MSHAPPKDRVVRYCIIAFALVFSLLGAYGVYRTYLRMRVNGQIARLAQLGYPTNLEEFTRHQQAGPTRHNGAATLAKAASLIISDESLEQKIPNFNHELRYPSPGMSMNPEMSDAIQAYLDKNQNAIDTFYHAATFDDFNRNLQYTDGVQLLLPHLAELRRGMHLSIPAMYLAIDKRDAKSFLQHAHLLTTLTKSLAHEPLAISHLVSCSIEFAYYRTVPNLIQKSFLRDTQYKQLAEQQHPRFQAKNFQKVLAVEMLTGIHYFQHPDISATSHYAMIGRQISGLHDIDQYAYLHYAHQGIVASQLPTSKIRSELMRIDDEIGQLGWAYSIAQELSHSYDGYIRTVLSTYASQQLIETAIAIERFRLKHKHLPQTLEELIPTYLDAAPIDPFSNTPPIYKHTSAGYRLYSVSADGIDDGGHWRQGQTQLDTGEADLCIQIEYLQNNTTTP